MKPLIGIILFTGIEVVGLVAWLILAGLPFAVSAQHVAAVMVLAAVIGVEHLVAYNVGAGRPFFSIPQ